MAYRMPGLRIASVSRVNPPFSPIEAADRTTDSASRFSFWVASQMMLAPRLYDVSVRLTALPSPFIS